MSAVTCMYCKKSFDKEKEENVKLSKGYVHKKCYDEKLIFIHGEGNVIDYNLTKVKDRRTCKYCNIYIDISKEEYFKVNDRFVHKKCYEKDYTPDDEYITQIYDFLKSIGMSVNYTQCERQRDSYIKNSGYTNEGILNALKYFYLVKKQSPAKSGNRIGIVPYVYDEAKQYYSNMKQTQAKIAKSVNKHINDNPIEIKVNAPEKRKQKVFIDLDKIGEDIDR